MDFRIEPAANAPILPKSASWLFISAPPNELSASISSASEKTMKWKYFVELELIETIELSEMKWMFD